VFTTPLVIATLVATATGATLGFVASQLIARSAIERLRVALADALWRLSHDPLTGLYNRTGLETSHAITATFGDPQPIIVMLIDLDLFKEVNDTHSHHAGDELLQATASRIKQLATIYGGHAARLSGDEFVAIMPLRSQPVSSLAQKFTSLIAEPVKVNADNGPVTVEVTASVGVAVVSSADLLEDIALHRADTAMYHAKREGGNRHLLHTPGMTMPGQTPRRGPRLRDQHHTPGGSAE
jgi:diguanylate cyclase (GGDEF)-like protein